MMGITLVSDGKEGGEAGGEGSSGSSSANGILTRDVASFLSWAKQKDSDNDMWQHTAGRGFQGEKKEKKMTLKQLLLSKESGVGQYGPEILEHVILSAGLTPGLKVPNLASLPETDIRGLLDSLVTAEQLSMGGEDHQGYYFTSPSAATSTSAAPANPTGDDASSVENTEFSSVLLKQHEGKERVIFPTFRDAVDPYKVEAGAMHKRLHAAENAALKKLAKVKNEAANQAKKLELTQNKMQKAALLVTKHAENIDKCILVLKSALDSGMAWKDVEDMVASEASRGNPIASMVKSMRLEKARVVLQLPSQDDSDGEYDDDDDDDNDDEGEQKAADSKKADSKKAAAGASGAARFMDVDLNLMLTAHANARSLFTYKKAATQKQLQTIESRSRAVAAVESATLKTIEGQKLKQLLKETRKVHWFERFYWFVTSDGHLVLSGKDAQQNELLVKRYLRKGDVYVHAEVHGAASCIVRYKPGKDAPAGASVGLTISPSALQEAGQTCICRSVAWMHKQVASAYWVHSHQVSKSAPSGEYLTAGSFMIYGKKNFLPPLMLEMGFGIMFRLDDASIARRAKSMVGRMRDEDEESSYASGGLLIDYGEESSYAPILDRYGLETETAEDGGGKVAGEGGGENDEAELEAIPEEEDDAGEGEGCKEKDGSSVAEEADFEEENDKEEDEAEADEPYAAYQKIQGAASAAAAAAAAASSKKGAAAPPQTEKRSKQKVLSKKKARRYAEQDDEDKALVLQALGHSAPAVSATKSSKSGSQPPRMDQENRRAKAGINLLIGDSSIKFTQSMERLHESVRGLLLSYMEGEAASIQQGEIGADEIASLCSFAPEDGLKIVQSFCGEGGANLLKKGNKSAFLAGVMRRFTKENATPAGGPLAAVESGGNKGKPGGKASGGAKAGAPKTGGKHSDAWSAGAALRQPTGAGCDAAEEGEGAVQAIMEEEGIFDDEEGELADEVDKLAGFLLPDDVVLYAVPVCGPYACMRNFKFKVKLTPGVMKKGKVSKTAVEGMLSS